MFQRWVDLLFAHWPLRPEALSPLIPAPLELETFAGRAWVGLTSFQLEGLRPRFLPPVPSLSSFSETNLRTYVQWKGKPGVFFFTLEADSRFAVLAARLLFRLPYHFARMEVRRTYQDRIDYSSVRPDSSGAFRVRYRATGPVYEAATGSLPHFLTERYALYVVLSKGRVFRGDIHHRPWRLQTADAEIDENQLPAAYGIDIAEHEPLLHYASRQDTLVWSPRPA
ncbi:MAG: DUF2071 domain-containing protein [Gemmatimonas sp.]|nr:DUF2071 domain-containing protein [Gemmatimonas sp.]